MKIEKILFPSKFGELDFNVLNTLTVLKPAGLREIILCYVIPREEVGFVPFGGYLKEEEERRREEARIKFEDWARALAREGVSSSIVIETGDPEHDILALAERERVDLIVIGRRRMAAIEKFLLGSIAFNVLRRSKLPVLVDKYMVQYEVNEETVTRTNDRIFEKPLLAADWSGPSERALKLLMSLHKVVRKAAVVHVLDIKLSKGMEKAELQRIEKESRERLDKYCSALKKAGIQAEAHLTAGAPAREIMNVARAADSSMILSGTSGKDRLHELWLGSVSHRLADNSEIPTLLVP